MISERRRVVCSAPGRAGIIGNPTDMYGGAVLSCSVDMRARVTVTPEAGLVLETGGHEFRVGGRHDLRPRGDRFDVARAVLDYLHLPPLSCRIAYESEIPWPYCRRSWPGRGTIPIATPWPSGRATSS
jgi:hypothetical protein